MLELGRHQDANDGEVENIVHTEVCPAFDCDVMVENALSDEKALRFVVLLLMKIEYFLDSILPVLLFQLIFVRFLFLIEVILNLINFFKLADS